MDALRSEVGGGSAPPGGDDATYRDLVEHATEGIYRSGLDGRLIEANPALAAIYGYDGPEQMKREVSDVRRLFADPSQRDRLAELIAAEGRVTGLEVMARRRDGSTVLISANVRARRGPDGELLGFDGSVVDVTDRRRTEQRLREAEGRYRGIFEHAAEGIFQTTLDGRFLVVNPALARMLGYATPEELVEEVPDSRSLYADPSRRDAILRDLARRGASDVEVQLRRRDGSDLWVQAGLRAVRHADGRLAGLEGIVTDVTERRRTEEALRRNEELYRSVVENATEMIGLFDMEGRLTYVSPSARAILGFTPDELVGRSLADDIVHPGDVEVVGASFRAALDSGHGSSVEVRLNHRDGHAVYIDGELTLIRAASGEPQTVLGIAREVTERRAAREERERLLGQVVKAQEAERARIAADIHDDPIQKMSAVALRVAALKRSIGPRTRPSTRT